MTIGQAYAVSFEQSISFSNLATTGGVAVWDVTFGSQTLISTPMTTPSSSTPFGWQSQNLVFTATAPTQELVFLADQATGDGAIRVDLGLDGVTLNCYPNTTCSITVRVWFVGANWNS